MTRILVHSNGPNMKTGYGVQAGQLCRRLKGDGHEVAMSVTYGQQGSMGTWSPPEGDVPLYPVGYEVNGNDVIHAHAQHWFEGDERGGWIIPLLDVWCLVNPRLADFNVAAWAPVDHFPVPRDVLAFFHRTNAKPIAMSRFGERLFFEAGLDPAYIPLAVDTKAYKPTREITAGGRTVSARELFHLPTDAFVVGMVGMNKGWARDRKGFNEAFRAFAVFWQTHQNAVLFMHSEKHGGAEGIDLTELAVHAGIPDHALVWSDQYAYRLGLPAEMMAAAYTAMDVLLSPSHGEGFCVPLIEAQACGTPVIATDFSAQTELVGAGWLVSGQPEWDPAQHASYVCPFIGDVVQKLELAFAADLVGMQTQAIEFAAEYDADLVFDNYWRPFLKSLEPAPPIERPAMDRVDVIVPAMRRENMARLVESFDATNDGTADLIVVGDNEFSYRPLGSRLLSTMCDHSTYAAKVTDALGFSTADFVCIVGDDCEFKPGWIEAARAVSTRADVIGTNDSEPGRIRNPLVANGSHSDHSFIRRSYIDDEGASLDGPGSAFSSAYRHWFCDRELIELAKARGVFVMAPDSVIVHHHPGYDGDEAARQADPTYMAAVDHAEADRKTWLRRAPLIAGYRK